MYYVECHALDNFASIYFTAAFSFVYFKTINFKTLSSYALLHHTRFATIKFRHSDIQFYRRGSSCNSFTIRYRLVDSTVSNICRFYVQTLFLEFPIMLSNLG